MLIQKASAQSHTSWFLIVWQYCIMAMPEGFFPQRNIMITLNTALIFRCKFRRTFNKEPYTLIGQHSLESHVTQKVACRVDSVLTSASYHYPSVACS